MATYQTMSRPEADKIINWVKTQFTVTLTDWQEDIFAAMIMNPDLEFRLPKARRG